MHKIMNKTRLPKLFRRHFPGSGQGQVDFFLDVSRCSTLQNRCRQQTDAKAMDKFTSAKRLEGSENSVWIEFGRLTTDCEALNLGRGFPDSFPPKFITDSLKFVATCEENYHLHQYTRSYGHPRLVNALSNTYSRELGRHIDPLNEVLVSVGAYGALYCSHQGFVNPGDEVIILEPFFDSYQPMVKQAHGIPRFVSLKSTKAPGAPTTTQDWTFDRRELEQAFNKKTKLLIFNNPNNPLGKVYTEEEMHVIADLCKKNNVVVLADEVYERLVYPEADFIKMASLPGMYERTISIGSVGKAFSVTGWKIGWSVGPAHLIKALCYVHQNCNYTCPTPLQEAVAMCFERENSLVGSKESYFHKLPRCLQPKKERMIEMMDMIGMRPVIPEAGYFMVGDISNMDFEADPGISESKDFQFVKWMTRNKKLAAIPISAFYTQEHKHLALNLVRFCFFKNDQTLNSAHNIFKNWNSKRISSSI